MMHVITSENSGQHPQAMEQVWRFRHDQFVDRLKWTALRRDDRREIDQFDTHAAIHLPVIDGGEVVGYSRLLPSTAAHLLSDVYPQIMQGAAWPTGPRIYEWTRCIGALERKVRSGHSATNIVFTGVAEFCLMAGIEGLLVQTHPKLVTRLLETGWKVRPLAVPVEYDGKPIASIMVTATPETLRRHRELFEIDDSVLELDIGLRNPLHPTSMLCRYHLERANQSLHVQKAEGPFITARSN